MPAAQVARVAEGSRVRAAQAAEAESLVAQVGAAVMDF